MVSIIIPTWNRCELTVGCVESIRAFTQDVEHEVIFVDNGSTDDTVEYLKEACRDKTNYVLVQNEKNIGFPAAINLGLEFTTGDHILILNNDVIVTPEWLSGMMECLHSQDHIKDLEPIGMVGPMTNAISGVQVVMEGKYTSPFEMIEFSRNFRKSFKQRWFAHWRLPFFCTLIRREVFDRIGKLDEQFSPGNFEDDDFELRSIRAGFRHFVCGDVFIHHYCTQSHDMNEYNALIARNRKKFMDKWLRKTVSCCMIVKNEERWMDQCLTRISPMVDEIIVVDTGSTDRTKEIAAQFPKVKLFDFPWNNDFSAARNYSLEQATKDWIFVLDADEVVNGVWPTDAALHPMGTYRVEARNYTNNPLWTGNVSNTGEYGTDEKGAFWFGSTKLRLWPNDKRIRFMYPVHEVVEESVYRMGMFVDKSPFPVHHYGKLDEDWDNTKGKDYLVMLNTILADDPHDVRNLEQLGAHHQGLKHWDDAIAAWDRIIAIDPLHAGAYHNKGHALANKSGDWQGALDCFIIARSIKPDDRDTIYNEAYSRLMLGQFQESYDLGKMLTEKHPDFVLGGIIKGLAEKQLKEV